MIATNTWKFDVEAHSSRPSPNRTPKRNQHRLLQVNALVENLEKQIASERLQDAYNLAQEEEAPTTQCKGPHSSAEKERQADGQQKSDDQGRSEDTKEATRNSPSILIFPKISPHGSFSTSHDPHRQARDADIHLPPIRKSPPPPVHVHASSSFQSHGTSCSPSSHAPESPSRTHRSVLTIEDELAQMLRGFIRKYVENEEDACRLEASILDVEDSSSHRDDTTLFDPSTLRQVQFSVQPTPRGGTTVTVNHGSTVLSASLVLGRKATPGTASATGASTKSPARTQRWGRTPQKPKYGAWYLDTSEWDKVYHSKSQQTQQAAPQPSGRPGGPGRSTPEPSSTAQPFAAAVPTRAPKIISFSDLQSYKLFKQYLIEQGAKLPAFMADDQQQPAAR